MFCKNTTSILFNIFPLMTSAMWMFEQAELNMERTEREAERGKAA